jgi:hypothetical protein
LTQAAGWFGKGVEARLGGLNRRSVERRRVQQTIWKTAHLGHYGTSRRLVRGLKHPLPQLYSLTGCLTRAFAGHAGVVANKWLEHIRSEGLTWLLALSI